MADPIRLDLAGRRAWQGDREISIPPMQFKLLTYLMAHADEVVTHEQLLRDLWRIDWVSKSKSPTMHICWLRRVLGDNPVTPDYIVTMPGGGYRFISAMVARPDVDPLDTYWLMPHAGPGVRPVVACPHDGCFADLIAGEDFPISTGRVRVLAAAHEVEHLAVGRG